MKTINNEIVADVDQKTVFKINLLIKQEVFQKFKEDEFITSWNTLYDSCSWATVFQCSKFVVTWYNIFRENCQPILITAYENDILIGLLPLALYPKNKKIVGAGKFNAEYQTWLALAHLSDKFIIKALEEVIRQYPGYEIEFKYLPTNTPLDWLSSDSAWKYNYLLRKRSRPLLLIDSEHLLRELRKKNRKEKINRLKRLGNLSFERITDAQKFATVFDTISEQYDFRQASKYNRLYFRSDPLKKELLLELFNQDLLHVSVLKLNNKIIAANVGAAARNWVHLKGMNTWSPVYAKYSPGILQFLMLGQHLSTEGYTVFDLTPGDDPYKEILATAHDEVYELWIYGTRKAYLKNLFRKELYFKLLKRMGTTPLMFELQLKMKIQKLKQAMKAVQQHGFGAVNQLLIKQKILKDEGIIYELDLDASLATTQLPDIKEDDLHGLLGYNPGSGQTKSDFLSDALSKFEAGEHCYTLEKNNELIASVWFFGPDKESGIPSDTILMHDVYHHPNHITLLPSFILSAAIRIRETNPEKRIYISVRSKEQAPGNALKIKDCNYTTAV